MSEWFEAEEHVERAHELYEAGRWDEAEAELRHALSLNPERAEWHFNLGLTLEAAGRWEDALKAFNDAHRLDPGDFQVLCVLGVNSLRLERFDESIRWFNMAEEADRDRIEPFIHRIEAYARKGDHEHAEVMFYRSLQLEGDRAMAYANMAESLIDRREWQRAMYCLREAASIDANLERVNARLAHVHAEMGRREQARQLYLRELREHPGDIDTLLDLGCLLVDMGRFAEASEKFRRVLELEKGNPDAHFYLGELAMRQHRWAAAETSFRVVLRVDQKYPEVRRRLAQLAMQRRDLAEARRQLRRELRDWRDNPATFGRDDLEDLAALLLDVRLAPDAIKVLDALVVQTPEDAHIQHLLSVAHFQSGDRLSGMECCRKALRLTPELVPALHNMALACVQERQFVRARYYVREAHRLAPDDHSLRRLRLLIRFWTVIRFCGWAVGKRPAQAEEAVR